MASGRTPRAPRLEIEITDEIIREAIPRDSSYCMIAEAVKAVYPDAQRVAVDLQTVRFTDPKKGLRFTYLTPRVAQVMLINFDQEIVPEPFICRLTNGQVTRSGQKIAKATRSSGQKLSPAQLKQRNEASKKGQDSLAQARLVSRGTTGSVPDRVGGKTPPTTPFARRRSFGLRALQI